MRVENVWLFVSLPARNTTALVLLVGAFLRGDAPTATGCSSPRWAQGAGGAPRPRRTLHYGCNCIEPAPMGEQLGSLHPPPLTLHPSMGQPRLQGRSLRRLPCLPV